MFYKELTEEKNNSFFSKRTTENRKSIERETKGET